MSARWRVRTVPWIVGTVLVVVLMAGVTLIGLASYGWP